MTELARTAEMLTRGEGQENPHHDAEDILESDTVALLAEILSI